MFRFFVDKKEGDKFLLSPETIKHIKVARVENENFICIYNQEFYITKLIDGYAKIIEKLDENHEFQDPVILAASLINFKKFDFLVQKATELGATRLIPVISDNISVKVLNDMQKKIKRWNKIALNAAEQSFRNKTMLVTDIMNFDDVLKINIKNKYIAHEKVNNTVIKDFPTNSLFLIGPEGGFSNKEIIEAKKNNFNVISLGKRILRAETASLFVLSRVN